MESPTNASPPSEAEHLEQVPLAQIVPSPTNPRKRFDPVKLRELADSIAQKGLISPVVLRPLDGARYELVVGERRYRASTLAGLPTILSVVRTLTDREVCELQLEENGQREDVHPLEEADAYQHLQKQGAAIEELAARTGKSVGYVRQRLQYCALGTEGREAFLDNQLTPATALLVARIPVPKLQADAVKDLLRPQYSGEPMGARAAGEHIRGRYMLRLADAPFNRGDAALVEGVPACGGCPKRTGAQPELFADVESPDTCTDPNCFAAKKEADWKQRTAAAKAKGIGVLSEKETKKVFPYGSHVAYESEYVDIGEKAHDLGEGTKSLKTALKGHLPPVVLARDNHGGVHELVRKSDLGKAYKSAGIEKKPPAVTGGQSDEQKKLKEKLALRRATLARALGALAAAVEAVKPDLAFWRFLLSLFITNDAGHDQTQVVVKRRALDTKKGDATATLRGAADGMKEPQLRGLLLELLCATPPFAYSSDYGRSLREACTHFGVDLKAIETEAKAEIAASKKAKGKKGAPPKPSPSKPSNPVPSKASKASTPSASGALPPLSQQPDVRVWIAYCVWSELTPKVQADLTEPTEGSSIDWEVRPPWVTARLPAEVAFDLRANCTTHRVPVFEGASPPAGASLSAAVRKPPKASSAPSPSAAAPAPAAAKGKAKPPKFTDACIDEHMGAKPPAKSPEVRVPTIPLADWNRLSSGEQHRLTWVTYPGQIGTGYTAWKVGETAATGGTVNMGTDYQRAIAAIALELGITVTWEPWVEPSKSKAFSKPAKRLTTKATPKPSKSGASKVFG